MRIQELLESFNFKEEDFIKHVGDKQEIDYDLVDDLLHFMNNDDSVYRRHVFPAVIKCIDLIKVKKPTSAKLFSIPIGECYKEYIKKFPIRELPQNIDKKTLKDACDKMHEAVCNDIKEGKYKD